MSDTSKKVLPLSGKTKSGETLAGPLCVVTRVPLGTPKPSPLRLYLPHPTHLLSWIAKYQDFHFMLLQRYWTHIRFSRFYQTDLKDLSAHAFLKLPIFDISSKEDVPNMIMEVLSNCVKYLGGSKVKNNGFMGTLGISTCPEDHKNEDLFVCLESDI